MKTFVCKETGEEYEEIFKTVGEQTDDAMVVLRNKPKEPEKSEMEKYIDHFPTADSLWKIGFIDGCRKMLDAARLEEKNVLHAGRLLKFLNEWVEGKK